MNTPKMHPDEIDIDAAQVGKLIATQFPRWAGLALRPVASSGTVNALYRLGDDKVVRLPRVDWSLDDSDKTHEWLPRIASWLPVDVPMPLAQGRPGEGYPWNWSVYRWLDGDNPDPDHLSDPDGLALDLAEFIQALRRIDATDGPEAYRGGPLARQDRGALEAISQLHGLIDTPAATDAWERALAAPPWLGKPVWLHGDLLPGNLLVTGGRLRAVIDFEAMGIGDPACDLIIAWSLMPAGARQVFRHAVDVDDATWDRGRGWALAIALIQLPYYRHTNPTMAANALLIIREILRDR